MPRLPRRVTAAVLAAALWATPAVAHADGDYTVKPGDSLYGIAASSGISLASLLSANQLSIFSDIHPGQQLVIPGGAGTGSSSATPAAGAATHTVKWGDTLSGIARRYRVSLSALLSVNGMTVNSLIMPGMKLRLPAGAAGPSSTPSSSSSGGSSSGSSSPPSASSTATHTVEWGDTLSGIARRYGVSLSALLATNNMSVTSLIVPGMKLQLPAGATAPTSGPAAPPVSGAAQTGTARVVAYARAQQGKPYKYFTKGPDTFDCSGLTVAAYDQIGVKLIHHSASQARQGTAVDFHNEPIKAGDLVFLSTRGSMTINHVGIALGSTTWIHAVGRNSTVRIGRMPSDSSITAVRRYVHD